MNRRELELQRARRAMTIGGKNRFDNKAITDERVKRLKTLYELSMTLSGDPIDIFAQVARMIGELLSVPVVCLSEVRGDELDFLCVYLNGDVITNAGSCSLRVTPCATVEHSKDIRVYDRVAERFPEASFLKDHQAYAYCGFPALGNDGKVVAVTCLLDRGPHEFDAEDQELLRVFGQRIGMEIERQKNLDERRRAQDALQDAEAKFRRIFLNADAGIFQSTPEGRFLSANPALASMLGYDSSQDLVDSVSNIGTDLFVSEQARKECMAYLAAHGHIRGKEIQWRRKDGELLWLSESVHAVHGEDGEVLHYEGIITDITERRQALDALNAAKDEAEFANRAKAEFLANMSHELRTPLNAVIGFSELIAQEPFGPLGDARYSEYIDDIVASGRHLLSIINDILDLSKIDAGKLDLADQDLVVGDVVETALRIVRERAKARGVALETRIGGALPCLRADERAFRQMMINLLTNAVKFTPEGGQVTVAAEVDAMGNMLVSVGDTGIGIAEENLPWVMSRFGQVESSLTRKHEGTGLGLPLVKALVELHGGALRIDSEVGVGTTATLSFPAQRLEAQAACLERWTTFRTRERIDAMRHQNSVFHGLLKQIPWPVFEQLVAQYRADKGVRELSTKTQLVSLLYAQFAGASSLREIEVGLSSHANQLYHLGGKAVARSTLADANAKRPAEVFCGLFSHLVGQAHSGLRRKMGKAVRLIDATSLRLSELSADWARYSVRSCGAKAHLIYDPDADCPLYFAVTASRVNDITAAKAMPIEPDATYVYDLGYYDFAWWAKLHAAGCRIVTRLKRNTKLTQVEERRVPSDSDVLSDRVGLLPQRQARNRKNPFQAPVREIRVRTETGKEVRILSNDLKAPAQEIADLYKRRWAIELFFRWVKQALKIRQFLGVSENAVRIQIAVALIAFLLLRMAHTANPRIQIAVALIAFLLLRMAHTANPIVNSPLAFARLVRANLGRGLIIAEPNPRCSKLDHGEVVSGELLVARGDAPEVFDLVEETLDAIAQAIKRRAEGVGLVAVAAIGDYGHRFLVLDVLADPVRVVGLVAEHEAIRPKVLQKGFGGRGVVALAWGQEKAKGQALGVDQGVDLGRQSSPRATHATIWTPFFAPAAC
jgi:PAS domain S-box-containing protein